MGDLGLVESLPASHSLHVFPCYLLGISTTVIMLVCYAFIFLFLQIVYVCIDGKINFQVKFELLLFIVHSIH